MGENTNIQWADATVNFWQGCKKVSAGCKYCYMYRESEGRFKKDASIVFRSSNATFNKPLGWKEPKTIFTCSMSDFFIKEADEWRADAWAIIKQTPHHKYLILTKRPDRINQCLPSDWGTNGYDNVFIGVSVENRKSAAFRIPKLFEANCKNRFLSIEPLLENVDIIKYLKLLIEDQWVLPISWVIVGGESGNDVGKFIYRPSKIEWYRSIVKSCQYVHVPVFVKQLGTHIAKELKLVDRTGGDFTEPAFPEDLKVRELPLKLKPTL